MALLVLCAWALLAVPAGALREAAAEASVTPPKYAGTYRIEQWSDFEAKHLFHFFYLHPGGRFLLGAEWPGKETGRAAGTWRAEGGHLALSGRVRVATNQGKWQVPFRRTFRIAVAEDGIRLIPIPRKNRYGLLGWPNAYVFYRTRITPNLPGGGIPTDGDELVALMRKIAGSGR